MAPEPQLEIILTLHEGDQVTFQFRTLDGSDVSSETQIPKVCRVLEKVHQRLTAPTPLEPRRLFAG